MSELDEELESSLYSDDVNEEVREWIATTFARSTPGLRRKSLARRHTFRSVVQAVKASLYVKRYVLLLQPLVKFCGRSNVFLFGYDLFSV